ncbi:hypothetical protein GCM10022251_32930 [Phytohabitans flavus]|uniref:Uncharacterized protein n=1 Tax=Phytohabitans flavus TaxID=1076124 RepID=A0A6F8XNF8_9ACTN|nr:hypothetical protein [Phytohabitans flavus]BCB75353.1 hypothetical protein Pflav_017630 [Phytohabitans flavus]
MTGTYARFGEAVRTTLGTAAVAGFLCLVLAGVAPGGLAWLSLWAALVAAAAWFYLADHKRWGVGVALAGQFVIVIAGLTVTVGLVTGSAWVLLGGLALAGVLAALILLSGDQPGSDLGGPVD